MLAYLDTVIGFAAVMLAASLIITILTQMVSAVFSFRGSALRWGLQQVFKNIDPTKLPTIAKNADVVATEILTRGMTSDSIFSSIPWLQKILPDSWVKRFQLATAIRPTELVGILEHWAASGPPSSLKDRAGKPVTIPVEEIGELLKAQSPLVERQIQLLTGISEALKTQLEKAPALIEETVKAVRESEGKLEVWFKAAMDRVSQQFGMYMRVWTVIFSFALAAIAGLDSIQLLSSLYRNGDFRAAVVGAAPNLLARADQILPPGAKSESDAVASAMTDLYSKAIGNALAAAKVSISAEPQNVKTIDEAEAWIQKNVPDPAQQQAALGVLRGAASQALTDFVTTNAKNASDLKDIVAGTGIPIAAGWPQGFSWSQFLGVLVSGALLSLGAPFWFNSLKALTNLRPTVAGKVKEEEKAAA